MIRMTAISDTEARHIDFIEKFLRDSYLKELNQAIDKDEKSIIIDFEKIDIALPEISDNILSNPSRTIKNFKRAIERIDLERHDLNVRFTNLPESSKIPIKNIRSNHIGMLIVVEGTIRTCSDVRPIARSVDFQCPTCSKVITIKQFQQKLMEPDTCQCGRKGKFKLLSQHLVDIVNLTIEESPETLEGGEQPKRIAAFLEDDLVSTKNVRKILPGNKVRLIGLLKEYPIILRTGGSSTRYELIIDVNNAESIERDYESLDITSEDVVNIKALALNKNIFDLLISSIAPGILGHEKVKESIILQIFGGYSKKRADGTKTRGDIHVLLVGDPGVGKSVLLTYMTKLAPKAVYVTGKGTTAAGLTASVIRDEITKDWILEAGALVLANKGLAVIDELDKMTPEDRVATHEALEQQTVTINKANIHATLNAQSAVLAAANPKLGRFDPYSTLAEQINLPPTLINRFDLIFTIRDIPDVKRDEMIATHVLEGHRNPQDRKSGIEAALLRKYIAYSKQYCFPVLTTPAIKEIRDYYVKLRNKKGFGEDNIKQIPISARQLEALIRLSEASARVQLKTEVRKEDSRRAIDLFNYSMMQVGIDPETGELDIDRVITGISTSQRSRIITMQEILKELEKTIGDNIPVEDVIAAAKEKGIDESKAEELLNGMKKAGEIYEPKHGIIRRMK